MNARTKNTAITLLACGALLGLGNFGCEEDSDYFDPEGATSLYWDPEGAVSPDIQAADSDYEAESGYDAELNDQADFGGDDTRVWNCDPGRCKIALNRHCKNMCWSSKDEAGALMQGVACDFGLCMAEGYCFCSAGDPTKYFELTAPCGMCAK